jgi:hypothetical protein
MASRKLPCFLILLSILLSYSCHRFTETSEPMEAHYVQYKITYLDEMAGDVPTRILPSVMHSWYTDRFVLTKIDGFFRQFSLIQIADLRHRKVTTLLNVLGNKYYYRSRQDEIPACIVAPEDLRFTVTEDTTVIGGLHSRLVEVDTGEEKFNVYYTEDFSVRRPNLSTPYREITQPLSDFPIQLSYLKMHLSCKFHEERIIESGFFSVPDEYRPVSRPVMEEFINSLFTKD